MVPIRPRYGTVQYGIVRYLHCTIRTFFLKYRRKIHIAASTEHRGEQTAGNGADILVVVLVVMLAVVLVVIEAPPLVLVPVIFGFRNET